MPDSASSSSSAPRAASRPTPLQSLRTGWNATRYTALGALLVLLGPVLFFGPWLPLVDLVGFVGMYSYPPPLSQGPFHFYTFQFSYIGHHILSRFCCDLGLPIRFQIPLFYLLQVGICFGFVYGALKRLVPNTWVRCLGIALGTLAFWDGIFLWGGPFAHSLSAAFLSWATFLAIRDAAEPQRNASVYITLLTLFAMSCHPFAMPFALVLCGVRFLYDQRHRWQTVALGAGILVYGYIVLRDSPSAESGATGGLFLLFGIRPDQIVQRISGLFLHDALFTRVLFGFVPVTSQILFFVYAVIRTVGFLLSPYLVWKARSQPWLRMLATLNLVGGTLYLFSCDLPGAPISDWPQRVLTLYAPVTFLTGFIGIAHLVGRLRPATAAGRDARVPAFAWAVPVLILGFHVAVQAGIFRIADDLEDNLARARKAIIDSGVTNAYVVTSGMDAVRPFYLRCVPFVLFSDPEMVERRIIIGTEWHNKARHSTRIVEASFNIGRPRYLAEFSMKDGAMAVRMVDQPRNRFPVTERTNEFTWTSAPILAMDQFREATELLRSGAYAAALEHYNTAVYLRPDFAEAWNDGGAALYRAGQAADALSYFASAVQANPKLIDARVNLAMVLIELGRPQEAIPHLEEAVRLKPDHAPAREKLQQLRIRDP